MSQTIEIPNNVPVSWLQRLTKFENDDLMLASEPNADTETEFMSRYFTYYDLYTDLSNVFSMGDIWFQLSDLYTNKASLSDFLQNTLCCDINDPYIISSMTQGVRGVAPDLSIGMQSLAGYRLSSGMKTVFNNSWNQTHHIYTIIPSLTSKTTSTIGTDYCVTSITDYDGHVQSLGTTNIKTKVEGYASRSFVQNGPAGDSVFLKTDLSIQVLDYDDFATMRGENKLQKNVIYMTVNDPDDGAV